MTDLDGWMTRIAQTIHLETGYMLEPELLFYQGLQVLLVVLLAVLAERIGARFIERLFQKGVEREQVNKDLSRTMSVGLITLLRYGLVLVVALATLQIFKVQVIGPTQLRLVGVVLLKIIGTMLLAQVAITFGKAMIDHWFRKEEGHEQHLADNRSKTLQILLTSILRYGVYFVAGVMILDNFGVPTTSILAGAGIFGLAVGFGAQNLVRDLITGFFIILEDYYAVGDFVTVAGVTGTVEELGLRTTKVKEWTGQVHNVPNGEVGQVTNFSKDKMAAVVPVGIAYEEDIDRAIEVLGQAALAARQELPQIIEDPVVQGVMELGDSDVVLRVIAYTAPGNQWAVERELRKRLKQALDREGIEIPYPRRVVINQKEA